MELPYNRTDKKSILSYAKLLRGQTLRSVCGQEIVQHTYSGKGHFGQLIEKFYFGYEPNSNSEPDFYEAGLELKTSPLKQNTNKDALVSKERLVLNVINYYEVVNQQFESSDFWKKNKNLLLIFYLHEVQADVLDYTIKLVDEWGYSESDIEIIKRDYEIIKNKIITGKAHELSEGDTFYLGACTKGASSKTLRKQPYSDLPAKQRAFSLKQGYVNHIIASISGSAQYGKLFSSAELYKKFTIEDIVFSKFKAYYGRTEREITNDLGLHLNPKSKQYYANIAKAILGVGPELEIEEFNKADIEIKAIRVEIDNNIEQSLSFSAFEFINIYNESWDFSEMKRLVEKKFLFIFFKKDGEKYKLEIVKFWNMPAKDRNEVRRVWLKTKRLIQTGCIFSAFSKDEQGNVRYSKKGNPIRLNNFPKTKESPICHVRPHGNDSNDMYPLPVADRILGVKEYSKQSFWFKNTYVRDNIYMEK